MKTNTPPPPNGSDKDRARIRILATSDLHMNVTGFDYYADHADSSIGFTRTATLIRQARAEFERNGDTVLLFDNGDALQGTPFGDWAATCLQRSHPLMQAFSELGYDAIGLGNHDFSFGLASLDRILAQSPCPVLSSNAHRIGPQTVWAPSAILTRQVRVGGRYVPIRIGVLSVLPPQTAQWEAHRLEGQVNVTDALRQAREASTGLRRQGCDLVVALAHSGLGQAEAAPGLENAAVPMAALPDIDVLITGHTHLTLPGPGHADLDFVDNATGHIHGTPAVMPGSAGSHLGVIDLTLTLDAAIGWRVATSHADLRAVAGGPDLSDAPAAPEDAKLLKLFAEGHEQTRLRAASPVGTIAQPMHSFFSFCVPDKGLATVAAAQAAALRPYLAGTPADGLPVLSATAPSKFGGRAGPRHYTDIAAGALSMRHVADLNIFPNELRAVIVSGEDLRDWLEMSAGIFNHLPNGSAPALIDPKRAGHNFDVIFGLTYQIDPSCPARFDDRGVLCDPDAFRISRLQFGGRPVSPEQRFVVALNNYRANGGGHFPFTTRARQIKLPQTPIQDILRDYLSGARPSDPLERAADPFQLKPRSARQAILKTGPGAAKYLDELGRFSPRVLDRDADGFMKLHLSL